jgi:cation diffusion facilitator family transporter
MNLEEKISKLKKGERTAGIATITLLLLALVEAVIGFLSGAVILIADALHNATDSLTNFASWFGLKISQKRPTEKFPYGYYKAESLTTLLVSGFILYAAFELLLEGYSKIFTLSEISMPFQAMFMALVSLIVSYLMAKYMKKVGKEINSQLLIANSQERATHVFSSIIIFAAILLIFYRIPYVEGIITIGFSLLIFKAGIFIVKDSIFALMDVSPSKDIEDEVKKIINSIAGVEDFKNLRLRKSGPFVFGEVTVKIRKHVNVERAHEIADSIENKIKKEVGEIDSFTIHVEPYESEELKLAIPVEISKGLNSEVSEHFGRANYFIFITVNKKEEKIGSFYIKNNPYKEKSAKAGYFAADFIVKEKIDVLITKEIGGISFHTLRDNLVDIYKAKGKNVKEVVNNFIKDKLELLTEPTKEEALAEAQPKPETQPEYEAPYRVRRRGPWWGRW